MSMTKFLLLCGSAFMVTACTEMPLQKQYQHAVKDAAFVKAKERTTKLWAINFNNPKLVWNADKSKLLVVTWKSRAAYDKFIKSSVQSPSNPDYALWVTAAPQVKAFCQAYEHDTDEELNTRLKQYLGLAPDWQYDVFVEMWVSPEQLFRPCVDPETSDTQCEVKVPEKFPAVANIADYGQFYKNLYFKSFRESAGVPWTGLGYTYDWGKEQGEIGASEFILQPNSPYQIKQVLTTREYCAKQH
ncbi:MAG: hypothetical protein Q8Q54_03180 [Methylococcales bacterium]|nr:hypothetical protein [Methylococcales bacterium]